MKYLTIKPYQEEQQALSMIKRELGNTSGLIVAEVPQELMGNQKILILRKRTGLSIECKIDGPGFIIDRLYEKFLLRG